MKYNLETAVARLLIGRVTGYSRWG